MKIAFIGNCQTIQLCAHFQELKKDRENIRWICYNPDMITSLAKKDNCYNKITDTQEGIGFIQECDVVVYQKINESTSPFFNKIIIKTYNPNAKFISVPSMYFNCDKYEMSMEELKRREIENKVDVTITDVIEQYKDYEQLFISCNQPTDFLILQVVDKLYNFF